MPAVLPEFGFHDNPEEAQWLIDNMEVIAEETAKAVCEFFSMPYKAPDALYRVQVGAFRSRERAEAYLVTIRAAGFDGAYLTKA